MLPTVQRNHAGVVDHLGQDGDVVARLEKLQVVVVPARQYGRTGVESQNASVPGGQRFRTVREVPHGGAIVFPFLGGGRQGRNPTVGRVNDERGSPVGVHPRAKIYPESVVGAGIARRRRPVYELILDGLFLELRHLFVGQHRLVCQLPGPLERCQGRKAPRTLEIGMAVGRPRAVLCRRRLGVRGLGCQGPHGHE